MTSPPKDSIKVLSFLEPEEVWEYGLPSVAVQGTFSDPQCTPEGFKVNRAFIEFMHDVIGTVGPTDPSMQKEAARQENGYLYVIDLRTPEGPQGRVPAEDIIGGFEVRNGRLVAGSYRPNAGHRVFTKSGVVQLAPSLHEALVRAALERARDALKKSRAQPE